MIIRWSISLLDRFSSGVINNVNTRWKRDFSCCCSWHERRELVLVWFRVEEGRFDEVFKGWARLRKLAGSENGVWRDCGRFLEIEFGDLFTFAILLFQQRSHGCRNFVDRIEKKKKKEKKNNIEIEDLFFLGTGSMMTDKSILHGRQGRLLLCRCHMSMRRRASSFLQRANFTRWKEKEGNRKTSRQPCQLKTCYSVICYDWDKWFSEDI